MIQRDEESQEADGSSEDEGGEEEADGGAAAPGDEGARCVASQPASPALFRRQAGRCDAAAGLEICLPSMQCMRCPVPTCDPQSTHVPRCPPAARSGWCSRPSRATRCASRMPCRRTCSRAS